MRWGTRWGRGFVLSRGTASSAEHPEGGCSVGQPEPPVSYLGGRGAVGALRSAGRSIRGQQRCEPQEEQEPGRAHGWPSPVLHGQTDRQALLAPAALLGGDRMCPGLPDLRPCRNRSLSGAMPKEEPRSWHLPRPRMWLLATSAGRSGLLVMQLLHLKLQPALNLPIFSLRAAAVVTSRSAAEMCSPPCAALAAEPPPQSQAKPKGALKRRCFCSPCQNWP